MAITYTWKVTEVSRTTVGSNQDYVVQSRWNCVGSDENGNTGTFYGATPFTPNASQENFIPYAELTEDHVLSWIKSVVVDSYWNHVQNKISEQIELKKNPVNTSSSLPWQPSPTPATPSA